MPSTNSETYIWRCRDRRTPCRCFRMPWIEIHSTVRSGRARAGVDNVRAATLSTRPTMRGRRRSVTCERSRSVWTSCPCAAYKTPTRSATLRVSRSARKDARGHQKVRPEVEYRLQASELMAEVGDWRGAMRLVNAILRDYPTSAKALAVREKLHTKKSMVARGRYGRAAGLAVSAISGSNLADGLGTYDDRPCPDRVGSRVDAYVAGFHAHRRRGRRRFCSRTFLLWRRSAPSSVSQSSTVRRRSA